MIVTKVSGGGLGVQLFQYASAFSLAKHQANELVIYQDCDESYQTSFQWGYRLDGFKIRNRLISNEEFKEFSRGWLMRRVEKYLPYHRRRVIPWVSMRYDSNFLSYPRNVILEGVRSGAKFLNGVENDLRKVLQFDSLIATQHLEIAEKIVRSNSVSVHVRRGDYLSSPIHMKLGIEYFRSALAEVSSRHENLEFFIFSDDVTWCRKNFENDFKFHFVEGATTNTPIMDLQLMSMCNHSILSNSTFSWWGAFLGKSSGRSVIAPSRWFAVNALNQEFVASDFYPAEWILIDPDATDVVRA